MHFDVQHGLEHQFGMATANTPVVLSNFHFGIITSCSLLYLQMLAPQCLHNVISTDILTILQGI